MQVCAANNENSAGKILFLIHGGHTEEAISLYQEMQKTTQNHQLDVLQQVCLSILEKGAQSTDPQMQLLTLYGAGISLNEKTLPIMEKAVFSSEPQLQLIAINFLSRYQNDQANFALNRAISSNHPLVKLEAAFQLASKKYPTAVSQLEALMCKLDPAVHSIFPPLFAMIGNDASTKILRKFLSHQDADVRSEAILSIAEYKREDLLPQIRALATHRDIGQQEACLLALGLLKDEKSVPILEKMTGSSSLPLRLTALQALYRIGQKHVRQDVEAYARAGNIFAISMLGEMDGSEELLHALTKQKNVQIRANAAIALLKRADARSAKVIMEFLVDDSRDLVLAKIYSSSNSLSAWRVIPSASQNLEDPGIAMELSLNARESLLTDTVELPESDFLMIADYIFEKQQNDLVPTLIELLVTRHFPGSIDLLKKHQQKLGAPLIRYYCNLALFRLKEDGPYLNGIKQWIKEQRKLDLIQFRPFLPWDVREDDTPYELTPQETTRLFIESLEELARQQDDESIEFLLDTMKEGNSKYHTIIAGLLLRCTQ